MRKTSLFSKFLLLLNGLAALSLILAWLAAYISPQTFWIVALFGLAFPFILIVNLLFVLWWLIRRRRFFLISLAAMLLAGYPIFKLVQFSGVDSFSGRGEPFKVMSYNVRLFNLYEWQNNRSVRDQIFDLVKAENLDVVCFQEYYETDDKRYFNTTDTLTELLGTPEVHTEFTASVKGTQRFGIATFSKYPVVNKGTIRFQNGRNNLCIFSDLRIGEDTVRIYNAHLASIHLSQADYSLLRNFESDSANGELDGALNIVRLLKRAFLNRSAQAETLAAHIASCPYPLVVAGDFNDSPTSYAYATIANNLLDAFIESGSGFGATYNGLFPTFRIDYLLHSQELQSHSFRTLTEDLSDHYPVVAHFGFKDEL